jgi:hypothetical protein
MQKCYYELIVGYISVADLKNGIYVATNTQGNQIYMCTRVPDSLKARREPCELESYSVVTISNLFAFGPQISSVQV